VKGWEKRAKILARRYYEKKTADQEADQPVLLTSLGGEAKPAENSSFVFDDESPMDVGIETRELDSETGQPIYECKEYPRSTVIACYCQALLDKAITESGQPGPFGIVAGMQKMGQDSVICQEYAFAIVLGQVLTIFAAFAVIIVNIALKKILVYLTKLERHETQSAELSATTVKIFGAQFLNTAIITLLVNSAWPAELKAVIGVLPLPHVLVNTLLNLEGPFQDTGHEWYAIVGSAICTTMMINIIVPHLGPILEVLFFRGCKRRSARKNILTQQELNRVYEGPKFELAVRYAVTLNSLFVSMLYCGGMPILLPFAFFSSLISYHMDKIALFRIYALPPNYNEKLALLTLGLLPWALLLHLGMSAWMYGSPDLLVSADLNMEPVAAEADIGDSSAEKIAGGYDDFAGGAKAQQGFGIGQIFTRGLQLNVLPLFVIIVFIVMYMIFSNLYSRIVNTIRSVMHTLRHLRHLAEQAAEQMEDEMREAAGLEPDSDDEEDEAKELNFGEMPEDYEPISPYTSIFELPLEEKITLSDKEKKDGWRIVGSDSVGWIKRRVCVRDGPTRKAGDHMLTWEAMADTHSYRMAANWRYADALSSLKEANRKFKGVAGAGATMLALSKFKKGMKSGIGGAAKLTRQASALNMKGSPRGSPKSKGSPMGKERGKERGNNSPMGRERKVSIADAGKKLSMGDGSRARKSSFASAAGRVGGAGGLAGAAALAKGQGSPVLPVMGVRKASLAEGRKSSIGLEEGDADVVSVWKIT
jgi:hypothetical protein